MRPTMILTMLLALWALPADAQGTRVKGTIASIEGTHLVLATVDAGDMALELDDASAVVEVTKGDPAAIPAGSYLGIGASPQQPDGTFRAVQIVIFPESARGGGEGHRDWNGAPSGTMTNAAMSATVAAADGPRITLTTGGKTFNFTVPPDARVIAQADQPRSKLAKGMPVVVNTRAGADGKMIASRVSIGRDGQPPAL